MEGPGNKKDRKVTKERDKDVDTEEKKGRFSTCKTNTYRTERRSLESKNKTDKRERRYIRKYCITRIY